MGLNQVIRVAGESDEDREVRLQALRVLDPGSVPLELVVSVLVTVVSFTLTCFSSHLIVTGTDPGRASCQSTDCPRRQYGYSGHVVNLPQDVASFDHKITNETRCLSQNNFKTHQPSSQDYSNLNITQYYSQESGSIRSPINAEAY